VQPYHLFRWDEIALDKVTEMVSRKFVSGEQETVAQIYLKRGAVVPRHAHESEQMTYVLQVALKLLVAGDEVTLRDGEVLHISPGVTHQVEALDDTFVLGVFSPVRRDWVE
jgi:quercetin dioxygenase-like cupin family protein